MPSQLGEEQWVNRVRLDKTKRGQVNTAFGDGQVSCSEEDSEDDDEPGPGNNQTSEINSRERKLPGRKNAQEAAKKLKSNAANERDGAREGGKILCLLSTLLSPELHSTRELSLCHQICK